MVDTRMTVQWCVGAAVAMALVGCSTPYGVEQFGAMREVLRDGHTQARVALQEVVDSPHAFAVGALEGLQGEVTIVDGDVWVTRVQIAAPVTSGPEVHVGDDATLLTVATVDEWQASSIESFATMTALETSIKANARLAGIDTTQPFPFMLTGHVSQIDLHVVNGYCPHSHSGTDTDAQPWRYESDLSQDVVIIGFYAENAGGVMTHHGSRLHAHAVWDVDGVTHTGHIDRLASVQQMSLRLPGRSWLHRNNSTGAVP